MGVMQSFNRAIQGWVLGVICGIIAITFTFWGLQAYLVGPSAGKAKVKVNGEAISQVEFKRSYDNLRQSQAVRLGADFILTPAVEKRMKQQALDSLIMRSLLVNNAKQMGFDTTLKQTELVIAELPGFQVDGKFSQPRLLQAAQRARYTPQDFIKQLAKQFTLGQVQNGILGTAFSLPASVKKTIALVDQQRNFSYLLISRDKFKTQVKVNAKQIDQYYKNKAIQFKTKPLVSVTYIELTLDHVLKAIDITDEDLQEYYDDNKDSFTTSPEWRISHILIKVAKDANSEVVNNAQQKADSVYQQAEKTKDFSALAKKYSADLISGKQGGQLPWFTAGVMGKAFDSQIAKLNQVGQITKPFRTNYGFEIVKLTGLKKAIQKSFADEINTIKQTITRERAQQLFEDDSEKLATLTYANPDSLGIASKELHLTIQKTGFFNRSGAAEGIAKQRKVAAIAYTDDVLQNRNNSDLIQIDPGKVVVIRVNEYKPATVKPLAEVKDQIIQNITEAAATKLAQRFGEQIAEKLKQGEDVKKLLAAHDIDWKTASNVKRNQAGINASVVSIAFKLERPRSVQPFTFASQLLPGGDFAIVKLMTVQSGKMPESDYAKAQFLRQRIASSNGQAEYQMYVEGLLETANIERY